MLTKIRKMVQMKKQEGKKRQGFTLVELMVAMSIVILLGAAAFFAYGQVQQTRKMAQMQIDMDAIAAAALTFESLNINGQPPADMAALTTGLDAANSIDGIAHINLIQGGKQTGATDTAAATIRDPWNAEYVLSGPARTITCTPHDANNNAMAVVTRRF